MGLREIIKALHEFNKVLFRFNYVEKTKPAKAASKN